MNAEKPIRFTQASQAFLCDDYHRKNFTAFLRANSVIVDSSQRPEPSTPTGSEKLFLLKLTEESQPLQQAEGDALIARFLTADEENKARHK
jgi:hypothetical protein